MPRNYADNLLRISNSLMLSKSAAGLANSAEGCRQMCSLATDGARDSPANTSTVIVVRLGAVVPRAIDDLAATRAILVGKTTVSNGVRLAKL